MLEIASDWGIDNLKGALFQGGQPIIGYPGATMADGKPFDVLVLCAYELQFSTFKPSADLLRVYRCPLDDAVLTTAEATAAIEAGKFVARKLAEGKRVLVTCQQGRNRSGLVSAIALVVGGMQPHQAIRLIQQRRKNALTNPSFVRFLMAGERR
jgi:protein-tyrosine phosphatase